jgi:hypothetical protein
MSAGTIVVIAVIVIVASVAAFFADRVLDAAVGGSYALVQIAWARRGHRMFWIVLSAAVLLAVALTVLGVLANAW